MFSKVKRKGLRLFGGAATLPPVDPLRPRILFVSHEATRTGAPMIILNVLRYFASHTMAQCDTILHNGGLLADQFCQHGQVDCLNVPRKSTEELARKVRRFLSRSQGGMPILAICNSMESRFIAAELDRLGIPVIFLVHELPSSYTDEDYRLVCQVSRHIIFPAEAVRRATHEKTPLPDDKVAVMPQGLLDPQFGQRLPRDEARRRIRQELKLPDNAFIVLGCGTLDLRKGIDHFAAVARQMVSQRRLDRPVHFLWAGDGPRWTHSTYHYVQLDIDKSNARGHVHFIGERENVEPYFLGADAFLMTSRVDPFPCVIHEAMAAQLPVITFEKSGGAVEALSGGAGIIVPYADYQQVVNMICLLAVQTEIAETIRQKSYERVTTHYRFSDYADRLIELAESTARRSLRVGGPANFYDRRRAA